MNHKNKSDTDDIIKGKLSRVCDYAKLIKDKTFGPELEGGKNKMAMAVIFEMSFHALMAVAFNPNQAPEAEYTKEQNAELITRLDFIIDIYNATDATWNEFWEGKQPIHPERIHLLIGNKIQIINLKNVTKITTGNMGFK